MITCKASNFNFGTLSPHFKSIRNPGAGGGFEITKTGYAFPRSYYKCMVFSSSSSVDGPKWYREAANRCPLTGFGSSRNVSKKESKEEEDGDDNRELGRARKVHCEVEVISWRERRIKAEMLVNADIESVWKALTDYERLADFVPNLVSRY